MAYWYLRLRNWLDEQKGQDLAEYALLIGLIALVVIVAVTSVGDEVERVFDAIVTELEAVAVGD
jgi:pilus assembly protein Flp/PilA